VKTTEVSNGNTTDNLFLNFADGLKPNKMSVEQLRRLNGFTNISDDAALKIIDGLYQFSVISYGILKKEF
jgi:hypothetical protein